MILYFNNIKGKETNVYIDFPTIYEKVSYHISESSLYRLLQRRVKNSYRYRNRDLYPFKDLLEINEISQDLRVIEYEE